MEIVFSEHILPSCLQNADCCINHVFGFLPIFRIIDYRGTFHLIEKKIGKPAYIKIGKFAYIGKPAYYYTEII